MLNFDSKHKFTSCNLNDKAGKQLLKKSVVGGLFITNLFAFSGCVKTVDCDIEETHAHLYVNDKNLGRYIFSEKETVSGLDRQNKYVYINDENKELLKFINNKNLFKIEDNKSVIEDITSLQTDFKEYRYEYHYFNMIPIYHRIGNTTTVSYNYIPMTGYSWTTDTEKSDLTGEERLCHYEYYGFKIIKNEKGEYDLIKSDYVDNINDLPAGYDYVNNDFYTVVNYYDRDEILDYEDGPEDDKELISKEEYEESKSTSR